MHAKRREMSTSLPVASTTVHTEPGSRTGTRGVWGSGGEHAQDKNSGGSANMKRLTRLISPVLVLTTERLR